MIVILSPQSSDPVYWTGAFADVADGCRRPTSSKNIQDAVRVTYDVAKAHGFADWQIH